MAAVERLPPCSLEDRYPPVGPVVQVPASILRDRPDILRNEALRLRPPLKDIAPVGGDGLGPDVQGPVASQDQRAHPVVGKTVGGREAIQRLERAAAGDPDASE